MRILLVDDDEALMESLTQSLVHQRYAVDIALDGSSAQTYLDLFHYDLVVLDLMLPDGNGIELCQRFRSAGYTNPLMILTAKESTREKVRALDAGSDDYVVKPFDFDELCARIRALLRRDPHRLPPVLQWGPLSLDPSTCETTFGQQSIRLTPKEFSLMELFLRHPHRVYSLGRIIDDLWSLEDPPGDDAIRTHIKGLRRKLQAAGAPKDLIKTVYGMGYRLNRDIAWLPETKMQAVARPPSASSPQHSVNAQHSEDSLPWHQSWHTLSPTQGSFSSSELPSCIGSIQLRESWEMATSVGSAPDFSLDSSLLSGSVGCLASGLLPKKLAQACKRYLRTASQQVSILEEAAIALHQGNLNLQLQAASQMNAHKLAGSLGSFGMPEGSRMARQLETHLRAIAMFPTQQMSDEANDSDADHRADGSASPQVITQLVEQLRQQINQATAQAAAQAISTSVQTGTPLLLLITDDELLSEQLMRITSSLHLQIQVMATPQQAEQRFILGAAASDQLPDIWVFDLMDEPAPFTVLIEHIKQNYAMPVVALEENLPLSSRLALINQGVDLVSDRNALPLQIIEAAMGTLQASTRHVQIAIADDDPQMLALLKTSLEPWGFAVNTFESALALWHWLTAPELYPVKNQAAETDIVQSFAPDSRPLEPPKADILVLDIEMPEMTGIELCRVLRADARFQTLPILFLTVHQEDELRMQAFQVGADDFIDKAVATAELATRLRNHLARACRLLRPNSVGSNLAPSQK